MNISSKFLDIKKYNIYILYAIIEGSHSYSRHKLWKLIIFSK